MTGNGEWEHFDFPATLLRLEIIRLPRPPKQVEYSPEVIYAGHGLPGYRQTLDESVRGFWAPKMASAPCKFMRGNKVDASRSPRLRRKVYSGCANNKSLDRQARHCCVVRALLPYCYLLCLEVILLHDSKSCGSIILGVPTVPTRPDFDVSTRAGVHTT